MQLNLDAPTALEHFKCLVGHDVAFPVFETALSLAQDIEPDLDVQKSLLRLDLWIDRLQQITPASATELQRLRILNEFFYETLGFAENKNYAADPVNSYVHRVLDCRCGIPISLAIIWLELADGLDLRVYGVSFPRHFLIKIYVEEGIIIQDPLTGKGLTQNMLSELLEPLRESWGIEDTDMAPLHMFLMQASGREIIERLLLNLKGLYEDSERTQLLLGVLDRLIVLRPMDAGSYRDRGLILAQMGLREEAVQDLQTYLRTAQTTQDFPMIEARLELLRAEH